MIILFYALVIFWDIRFASRGTFFDDSFSVAHTRALKGLFAITVVFHHLYSYLSYEYPSLVLFKNAGHLMVGGFFLISGYGLMWGVIHKENYLRGFVRKRILTLLITYYLIDVLYIVGKYTTSTDTADFKKFFVESIFGLNLWFVPVMVFLYIVFRLSFIGYGKMKNKLISPVILTVATAAYVVLFFLTQKMKVNLLYGSNWNDTALCFVIGMWYCILKDKIKTFIEKYYYIVCVASALIFTYFFYQVCNIAPVYEWPTKISTLFYKELSAIIFCVLVLLLSMKIRFGNRLLNIIGDLSFEIYLSHSIFIALFRRIMVLYPLIGNRAFDYLYNSLFITAVFVSSFVFSYIVHKLCRLILKPIQKSARRAK